MMHIYKSDKYLSTIYRISQNPGKDRKIKKNIKFLFCEVCIFYFVWPATCRSDPEVLIFHCRRRSQWHKFLHRVFLLSSVS